MTAQTTNTGRAIGAAELLTLYERMALIRATEKAAYDLFVLGLVKGTTHLAAGHEAVAVGASAALRDDDYVFATYRGHHHAMARGATAAECLAELMSKGTGVCKAKGGSMHLTKASAGMLGSYAIVGAHLPMAAGAAWSARLRGTGQVAVAFFGDGATNIGAFHEALNLASVWKLPALFICENNLYMEYTPISQVTSVANPAADRAAAYSLPGLVIDGNDVVRSSRSSRRPPPAHAAARAPLSSRRARTGTTGTAARIRRSTARRRKWKAGSAATRSSVARGRLESAGVPPDAVAQADERVARVVAAAIEAGKAAPGPDPAEALTDVWADGGAAWRT